MKNKKNVIEAFFVIVGGVLGLGVFAIPFAAKRIGVFPGVVLIFAISILMVILNTLFSEIILFTKKNECIIAYSKRYLGRLAKIIETFSIIFGYSGSLLAYTLATAVFVTGLFSLDNSYFWPIILVSSAVTSVILLNGFRGLGKAELFFSVLMCLAFFLVFFKSIPFWEEVKSNWTETFLPYGVVLFALSGEASIPIAIRILGKEQKKIGKIILWAYFLIAIITALFFVSAAKTSGAGITADPFVSISLKMGQGILYIGSLLGLLAVVTSHWAIASYLKKILITDLKFKEIVSWFFVVFFPLVLILLGAYNFVHIIGLVGVVAGTIDALMILAIYKKVFSKKGAKTIILPKKAPTFFIWIIFLIFLGAALSSIFS